MREEVYGIDLNNRKAGLGFKIFFLLYLILPEYFAIEFSASFPLLTASRVILFFMLIFQTIKNRGIIKFGLCKNKKLERAILLYIFGMVTVNFFHINYTAESVKEIFTLIFEQLCLVWLISQIVNTRKRFIYALRLLVYSSGIVAVISIVGSIIGYNLFYLLTTVNRTMIQAGYVRMGVLRAEAGFGHAVYYGMYCVIMTVLGAYLYERDSGKKIQALSCVGLNIVACLFANSRGSLVVLVIMLVLTLFNRNSKIIRKYIVWIGISIAALIIVCIVLSPIGDFISGMVKSLLAIMDKTISLENYGANEGGMDSRWAQLTCLYDVAKNNFLFGYGAGAHSRARLEGGLKCFWMGKWRPLGTFDMGLAATVGQYGYVGEALKICLFVSLLQNSWKKRKTDPVYKMLLLAIIAYLLGLLTISALDNVLWVLIGLLVSYVNIDYKERQGGTV